MESVQVVRLSIDLRKIKKKLKIDYGYALSDSISNTQANRLYF